MNQRTAAAIATVILIAVALFIAFGRSSEPEADWMHSPNGVSPDSSRRVQQFEPHSDGVDLPPEDESCALAASLKAEAKSVCGRMLAAQDCRAPVPVLPVTRLHNERLAASTCATCPAICDSIEMDCSSYPCFLMMKNAAKEAAIACHGAIPSPWESFGDGPEDWSAYAYDLDVSDSRAGELTHRLWDSRMRRMARKYESGRQSEGSCRAMVTLYRAEPCAALATEWGCIEGEFPVSEEAAAEHIEYANSVLDDLRDCPYGEHVELDCSDLPCVAYIISSELPVKHEASTAFCTSAFPNESHLYGSGYDSAETRRVEIYAFPILRDDEDPAILERHYDRESIRMMETNRRVADALGPPTEVPVP